MGDADVGGTETTKITGGVNVAAVLDDINAALEKMRSLGLDGSAQLPEQITPEQKQQVIDSMQGRPRSRSTAATTTGSCAG